MALFLQPVFKDRIWGGHALKAFNYDIPNETIGECWAISAHPNGLIQLSMNYTRI